MGVIRLFLLAILAYAAWVLVRGLMSSLKNDDQADAGKQTEEEPPVQDVLVEDPFCHTLIPKHQAVRLRKDGTTHYFCSEECCDKFSESARGEQ